MFQEGRIFHLIFFCYGILIFLEINMLSYFIMRRVNGLCLWHWNKIKNGRRNNADRQAGRQKKRQSISFIIPENKRMLYCSFIYFLDLIRTFYSFFSSSSSSSGKTYVYNSYCHHVVSFLFY